MAIEGDRNNVRKHGIRFTLRDMLLAIALLGCLFALLALLLGRMQASSRRLQCERQLRQVALGVNIYENVKRRFPLVSTSLGPLNRVAPGKLGNDINDSAGLSLISQVGLYLQESSLCPQRVFPSLPAFSPENAIVADGEHAWTEFHAGFRCPAAVAHGAPATARATDYSWLAVNGASPTAGNYVALVGTHFDAHQGIVENGVIVSQGAGFQGQGIQVPDIQDGTSRTLILCESRERDYAAWYDGQACWVVGIDGTSLGISPRDNGQGASKHLLNFGATQGSPDPTYSDVGLLGKKGWPGAGPRRWGPSSWHPGGVVIHAFVDNHVQALSDDIDPTFYFRQITRDGDMAGCFGDGF